MHILNTAIAPARYTASRIDAPNSTGTAHMVALCFKRRVVRYLFE